MGQLTKPESEHRVALTCKSCDSEYWTDETQTNDCPECGSQRFEIHGPDGHDTELADYE